MHFDADEYLEIVNNEAYTEYDLWSQIGGIVGIFLGYSILQVTLTRIQLYFQILDRIKMHWLRNGSISNLFFITDTRDDNLLICGYQKDE